MTSSVFSSFPDIPAPGQVTVCERYGELTTLNQEQAKLEVKGYPAVNITKDSTRSLAQGENAKSAFLPLNETVSKRVYHAWLDMGLSGALEEIVNSTADTPNWLALTAQKLLLLTRWTKSLHGSFFPHLALSNEDIVANFTRLADWGSGPVRAFAWHPHTIKFSYALQDDTVRIHSHATDLVPILKHKLQKNVADLAWQPNSSSVLAVACQSCILIWHIEPTSLATRPSSSAAQVLQQNNHCPVTSVAWNPDGRLLVSASPIDTAMLVWDVAMETSTPIRRFGGGGVSLLSWSPDGGKLFAATPSNLFRVWETRSWHGEMWTSKTGRVKAACWDPHGNTVLFTTENEPIIYSLTFSDDLDEKVPVIGGSEIAVACADLSEVELQVDEDSTVKVGGVIQSMVWDETGERLAVMFKEYPDGNEETMATAGQGEGDSITSAPVDESDPTIGAPHSQRWTSTHTFAEKDKDDDDDIVDDSASDLSEEVPYPYLCHPIKMVNESDMESEGLDDDVKDPDYKADDQSSDDDAAIENVTEQTNHANSFLVGKDSQVEIQSSKVSSSSAVRYPAVAVEKRSGILGKGQRDWKRKHTCFICNERVCDIPRHVTAKHDKDDLVKEALSKQKGSKERRKLWRVIANKGTFKHNMKAKSVGGELHVFKRTSTARKPEEYSSCPHCYGYYLKKQLWRHTKKCEASIFLGKEKNLIQSSISTVSSIIQSAACPTTTTDQLFDKFIEKMKIKDEVHIVVKNDLLLVAYTKSLLEEGKAHSDISWTVRLLGKLLICIRELSNWENISWMELINPEHWNAIVNGVRAVSEFSYTENGIVVGKPNIALKCGQGLKGLIAAAEGCGLRNNDDDVLKKVKKMFKMYDLEWAKVSKQCHVSIKTRKQEKLDLLPLTSDITKLKEYCVTEIYKLLPQVDSEPTAEKYLLLAKLTLSRLITFNARRGGEPSKLKTTAWQGIREGSSVHKEELDALPVEEKKLAERLRLGYVVGKGCKKVPIIFPEETVKAIDVLMQHRESFITNRNNPYIFARLYKESLLYLRGSDCVREVCEMADLQQGSLLTATQMRKYLATTLQLLDMKESELRWVTDHLGHTVDVHKKWYRLSNRTVELTKVASILTATECGHLRTAHNVQFDDVSKETPLVPVGNDSSEPPNTNDANLASSASQYTDTEDPDGNEETMATAGQGEGDSITSAPVDETDPTIGAPHSQRWTSTHTFAEKDKDNQNFVALFRTKVSPLLEITPCGFVKGKDGETPHCIQFQPRCETGALLTVIWSSGRVGYIPLQFVASETVEYHKFHQQAVNLSQHLQNELYTEQLS